MTREKLDARVLYVFIKYELNSSLTSAERIVAGYDESRYAVSRAQIAQETGLSERTVRRTLTALVDGGHIRVTYVTKSRFFIERLKK